MNKVPQAIKPRTYLNPIGVVRGDQGGVASADIEDEEVDSSTAMINDPIVGMDRMVLDDKMVLERWMLAHCHLRKG